MLGKIILRVVGWGGVEEVSSDFLRRSLVVYYLLNMPYVALLWYKLFARIKSQCVGTGQARWVAWAT